MIAGAIAVTVLAGGLVAAAPSTGVPPMPRYEMQAMTAGGSDRIAELVRRIRVIQAQMLTAQARIDTLTLQRDQIGRELDDALARRSRAVKDVTAARKAAASADRAAEAASTSYRRAKRARTSAKAELAAAERSLAAAQARYEDVAEAADVAADAVARAEAKVRRAKAGSKARRKAFTAWQMAAVDDRAAHARQFLADDRATDEYVGVQAAQAALTTAEFSKQLAAAERSRARADAEGAAGSLATAKERRSRARAVVRQLEAEASTVAADLKAAKKGAKKLTARLAEVQESAVDAQATLAGRVRSSGVLL
jgi:chromosome segregation ATPase